MQTMIKISKFGESTTYDDESDFAHNDKISVLIHLKPYFETGKAIPKSKYHRHCQLLNILDKTNDPLFEKTFKRNAAER